MISGGGGGVKGTDKAVGEAHSLIIEFRTTSTTTITATATTMTKDNNNSNSDNGIMIIVIIKLVCMTKLHESDL